MQREGEQEEELEERGERREEREGKTKGGSQGGSHTHALVSLEKTPMSVEFSNWQPGISSSSYALGSRSVSWSTHGQPWWEDVWGFNGRVKREGWSRVERGRCPRCESRSERRR